nr:hypothetical protein [Tanacetum cinerariifolium]
MNLLNGTCNNCIYGDGKSITCNECEGMLRGGFCLPCNLKAENLFIYDQNAYSFNDTSINSNHIPQPQYENYLCTLCGNNSHNGYDCQQQFPFVYEQEPSYNQNYDDNYYPHDSPSFSCCDNCGGSHETFQCHPMDQNIDFSGSDQIQTPQYPEIHPPSQEISDEVFQANHSVKYKENLENSSNSNQEKEGPPQDSNIQDESKCDMPIQDQSSSVFTTFPNPLFKDNDDLTSSDDESLFEEDVLIEESKVYSNPLFDDDEINSDELASHVESNFVESLSNHDALFDSSQKIDYLEEFSGELAHINPEITKSDFDFEEEIHLIENFLYDNSSSRPLEEHNAEEERIKREHADYISRMEMLFTINPRPHPTVNANTIVESIPSSLIPIQDNDSQREEIDIVTNTDEVLPPRVENDDDSEGEIDAVEELCVDNSISNFENELSDNEESEFDNPSFPRPPPEPPDAEFDFELDTGDEISIVMNTIVEFDVSNDENDDCYSFMFVIRMFLPYLIYSEVFYFLSAENEDTIFDPGISV